MVIEKKKFETTKGVIRSRKLKKSGQCKQWFTKPDTEINKTEQHDKHIITNKGEVMFFTTEIKHYKISTIYELINKNGGNGGRGLLCFHFCIILHFYLTGF